MHITLGARRWLVAAVTVVLAGAGLTLTAGPAHAVVTTGISGTVSGAGVGALPNSAVKVIPVDPTAPQHGLLGTEADGTFAMTLAPGEYWVRFNDTFPSTSPFAAEWWGDSPTRGGSTKVVVTQGQVAELNPVLTKGGWIAGDFAAGAKPVNSGFIGFIDVFVADPTFPGGYALMGTAAADANGDYTSSTLPAGSYLVQFRQETTDKEGWWDDKAGRAAAVPVNVVAEQTTTGIDAKTLTSYGTITGTLTNELDGTAVAGVVNTRAIDETGAWNSFQGSDVSTDANGHFTVPVRSGAFRIVAAAYPFKNNWNGGTTLYTASDVPVLPGQATTVNFTMTPNNVVNDYAPFLTNSETLRVGTRVTGNDGVWKPSGATLTRQWLRDGVAIAGATNREYYLRPADAGHLITYRVTATIPHESGTLSTFHDSGPARVYLGLLIIDWPRIKGSYAVGHLLQTTERVTYPATTVRYRWLREGVPIPGATGPNHRLTPADRGKHVGVRITISRPGYRTEVRTLVRSTVVR